MKISYEFYPPKDLDYKKVVDEFSLIRDFGPRFISITYGALGGSQKKSIGLIKAFKENTDIDIAAHLTLVGKSKDELSLIVDDFKSLGVNKIVAIRGDSPEGKFKSHPNGFVNTSDFVEFLVNENMEVFVSANPEVHPESESFEFDLNLLRQKTLAGSNQAISQFCFEMKAYKKLINAISENNIQNELIAGIMPIYNIQNLCNMAERCGTKIPKEIVRKFSNNPADNEKAAIEICIKQLEDLQAMGVNSFHFYTLNQSTLLRKIFDEIGVLS